MVMMALFMAALILTVQSQNAPEDQVHFPIPGYNDHKWFSGTPPFTQVTFPLIWASSTTSSSNPKKTPKTTLSSSGSTEDPDAAASSEWYMKTVHLYLLNLAPSTFKSISTPGTKRLTFSTSNLQEELALVMASEITITVIKLLLATTYKSLFNFSKNSQLTRKTISTFLAKVMQESTCLLWLMKSSSITNFPAKNSQSN